MKALIIAQHEFKSLFLSPLAWSLLGVLQFIFAYLFLTQIENFMRVQPQLAFIEHAPSLTDIIVPPLFGNAGIILLLLCPILTMSVICQERRTKTFALLLSAPLSSTDIIVGKYLGISFLLMVITSGISLMPLSLALGGSIDLGKLACNALALTLLVGAFAAVGVFCSTLAPHPVLAAILSFSFLLLLWIIDWSTAIKEQANEIINYLSLVRHFQNLQTGLIHSADLGYFLLFIASFLWLSIRCLDYQRLQK
ncbi:MAG: ABC transporter permease [Methylococcaceae bacterium]|nr:MAG: ABC transporter permease [Methylococcaceae bacterium]